MLEKIAKVSVHSSQFPEIVYKDYLNNFLERKINHKFHYDSVKQSQKWLKIHENFSPARRDDDCINAYDQCFQKTAELLKDNSSPLSLIGLGCGGGEKDKLLVSHLRSLSSPLTFYPVDVSLSLSLISAQKVKQSFDHVAIQPFVCDLLQADDLVSIINNQQKNAKNIITFFGMIPNFTPQEILPILSHFLHDGDLLLFSANLSPGSDYLEGVKKILPQYDNDLTKDWLITILLDAGVEREDGEIKFSIETDSQNHQLKRIIAHFHLKKDINLKVDEQEFVWKKGETIQLFFSYRYTTPLLQDILKNYQIDVLHGWESTSEEEGVYLCQKMY